MKGIWYSVFHSISAFCNAGIDILGADSFAAYARNPLINLTTMILIVAGGIGYTVWFDITDNIRNFRKKGERRRGMFKIFNLELQGCTDDDGNSDCDRYSQFSVSRIF